MAVGAVNTKTCDNFVGWGFFQDAKESTRSCSDGESCMRIGWHQAVLSSSTCLMIWKDKLLVAEEAVGSLDLFYFLLSQFFCYLFYFDFPSALNGFVVFKNYF